MKKVRCGIVGLGQIGPMHCESVSQIENAQLVCVCDLDEEKAQKYAQMYRCDYTLSFDELIARDDIDLIHVCLPSGMHAEFGCKAGKNVIVEKPIDVSLEAADRLIQTCRQCNVKLSCISQHRFDPDIDYLKKAIEKGALGKISFGGSHTKWYRSQEYYDSGDWRGTWALDGGGALMKGWTELIYKETGMEAVVEENPLEATAVGAMRAVPMAKKLRNYENSTLGN